MGGEGPKLAVTSKSRLQENVQEVSLRRVVALAHWRAQNTKTLKTKTHYENSTLRIASAQF